MKKGAIKYVVPAEDAPGPVVQDVSLAEPVPQKIGAFAAKTHLSEILEHVSKGETFLITKHGKPIAELKPITSHGKSRAMGWGKGDGFWMAPDFDAPLEDFKDYM